MRSIDDIIIHCTATPEGREYTAEDIRRWHKARGFADIGYHYLVHLDGRVDPGRPLEKEGAHCTGHNAHSIGVAYIGGLAYDARTPKDTRTPAQTMALRRLVRDLMLRFPNARLHGHRDYSSKACPCFEAHDLL